MRALSAAAKMVEQGRHRPLRIAYLRESRITAYYSTRDMSGEMRQRRLHEALTSDHHSPPVWIQRRAA
jgi:hypothetical protein